VPYHRVLAGAKRRIGRGILAILLLMVGFVIFPTVIGRAAALIDVRMGNTPPIRVAPTTHRSTMPAA
jgi:hypothetical protein